MKVTVYRPKLPNGLGSPQGFRAELHPTEGDWVQSAKSVQPDGRDQHAMLHQMGRDFLIYSMYHVREPRFMGYAVENFGAACKILGYSLPLKENEAVWLTYLPSELEPASPEHNRWMLKQIGRVFGLKAAQDQASSLGIEWPRKVTPKQLAEAMKREILEDVQNGIVPKTVESFSQLHDFVDANCYGGTEALLDELDDAAPDTDEGHSGALSALCDLCNSAMNIVDAWIKEGGVRDAANKLNSRKKPKPGNGHSR